MKIVRGRYSPAIGDITDLTANAISDTEIQLAFTGAAHATSYERRLDGGPAAALAPNFIVGTNDPLTPVTAYDIEVRGVRGAAFGPWSNLVTETTLSAGGAPVVANQTMVFGRKTLIGDGRCPLVATGDEITSITLGTRTAGGDHFNTSTRYLVPKAVPVDTLYTWTGCTATNETGTSDPFDLTIDTEANVYSADHGDLAAIIALGSSVIDGMTIKGRPGADIVGEAIGSTVTLPLASNYTTGLTITSHDDADQCFIRRLIFRNSGLVTLVDVKIRDGFRDGVDGNGSSALLSVAGVGLPAITLLRCEVYTTDLASEAEFIHSSGSGATLVSPTEIDLSAADPQPDLSTLNINGTTNAKLQMNGVTNPIRILTVNNVTKRLTTASSITLGAGNWAIGNISLLKLISGAASSGEMTALIVNDCTFHDYSSAIAGRFGNYVHIENCDFYNSVIDHSLIDVRGTETHLEILRNRYGRPWGRATDPQNPHCDSIQLTTGGMTQSNVTAYKFIGNRLLANGGRSHQPQFMLLRGATPPGIFVKSLVEHNVGLTQARNGIQMLQPASGTIVRGNTLLYDNNSNDENLPLVPFIIFETDGDGVTVEYNAIGDIQLAGGSPTLNQNHEFGALASANTTAIYADLYAGASFDSDDITDHAALVAAATPDASPLVVAGQVVIGAYSGYYDYDTGVSDAPWDEAGHDISGDFTDVTGAATSTVTTSNEVTLSGVSATGALVRVSGGNATFRVRDGSNNLIRDFDAAEYVVPNGYKITVRRTSSGSAATAVNTTVTVGATSDTWTITTA